MARAVPLFVLLAVALQATAARSQVVPNDGPPQGPRTGLIVGQVVDAAGTPVPEAVVQLTTPRFVMNPESPRGRVLADGDGRLFFAGLPPGEYLGWASKDRYADGNDGRSQVLPLAADERRADVTLRLVKFGVIAGTVVDEAGEPVVGVGVRAIRRQFTGGRPSFGEWITLGPTAVTDDRGMFRMAEMRPGTYVVAVPHTQMTLPIAALDAAVQDPSVRSNLFFGGIMEAAPLGTRGILQMGDVALLTFARVLVPPPPSPDGRLQAYRTTYFPSASTAASATPITIGFGEAHTDLTITLRPLPAARVSGRVIAPDGSAPPPLVIRMTGEGAADVRDEGLLSGSGAQIAVFTAANAVSDDQGRFTFLGVPPGEYLLRQASRFLQREVQQGREPYWFSQRITVGESDFTDLTVALQRGLRVAGRIEIAAGSGSTPLPPNIANALVQFETPFGEPGRFAVSGSRGSRAFDTIAAGGRYIVNAVETGGWVVQSITLDGKDVTDTVIDLEADATTFVITYTDRASKVSGTVRDARGDVSPNALVLAFPVDAERWTGYGPNPRRVRSEPSTDEGAYAFDHLPPGEYFVIALDDAQSEDWQDPKRLEVFARQATRLTIGTGAGASKTLDLTLKDAR